MIDACVIFDVDGVLLDLTPEEEDAFFVPLQQRFLGVEFSRDWNSYRIRNDENILTEIIERQNSGLHTIDEIKSEYLEVLRAHVLSGQIEIKAIPGAFDLVHKLQGKVQLGIATANFREAAQLRLETLGLWQPVSNLAFGANGGGHKYEILSRALANLKIDKSRIVYIGDNLNDVAAGLHHGVHFIGFSTQAKRLAELSAAGASFTTSNHLITYNRICDLLSVTKV